jgi:hypothetical protein
MPFLDKNGLAYLWSQIIAKLSGKVDREELDELELSLNGKVEEAKSYTDEITDDFISYSHLTGHNTSTKAHSDIRTSITDLNDAVTTLTNNVTGNYMAKANPVGTGSFSMNRKVNTTVGSCSHTEGEETTASASYSHAEGLMTTASGTSSHAEGQYTKALGLYSHAGGLYTIANDYQYVVGKYNQDTTAPSGISDTTATAGLFIVGIGTSSTKRANGFRVNPAGNVYGTGTYGTTGADYAEYFEWIDGNFNNEDRRGHFVTLDGNKIRYATSEDDYILGIVSAEPAIVGDVQSEMWHDMYLKDIYGNKIVEAVEVAEATNEHGEVIPAHIERRWVLNPEYDPDVKYVTREERPEWDAVGIVGKLVVIDDGTCQVNGYCYPSLDGIATASQEKTAYRVIERLDDTHVKVFIK